MYINGVGLPMWSVRVRLRVVYARLMSVLPIMRKGIISVIIDVISFVSKTEKYDNSTDPPGMNSGSPTAMEAGVYRVLFEPLNGQ